MYQSLLLGAGVTHGIANLKHPGMQSLNKSMGHALFRDLGWNHCFSVLDSLFCNPDKIIKFFKNSTIYATIQQIRGSMSETDSM